MDSFHLKIDEFFFNKINFLSSIISLCSVSFLFRKYTIYYYLLLLFYYRNTAKEDILWMAGKLKISILHLISWFSSISSKNALILRKYFHIFCVRFHDFHKIIFNHLLISRKKSWFLCKNVHDLMPEAIMWTASSWSQWSTKISNSTRVINIRETN